jgi:hypothetical protein
LKSHLNLIANVKKKTPQKRIWTIKKWQHNFSRHLNGYDFNQPVHALVAI